MGPCAGDPTCRAACLQNYRVGNDTKTPAFESCMVGSCASPCNLVCGGVAEAANPDAANTCQDCFRSQGCNAAVACMSDLTCATYAFCAVESVTPGACASLLDGGVDAASAFVSVGFSYCYSACELDSEWSCVGHVEWPPATSAELTIHLRVQDVVTQVGVPGVVAEVCNISDNSSPCARPTAVETTDDAGNVTLIQDPDAGPIFANGAYINLMNGPDSGIVPAALFWSFPISQSSVSFQLQTITPSELATNFLPSLPITPDPSTGYVVVVGYDCLPGVNGVGMTFTLSTPGSSRVFYERNQTIDPGATETDTSGTALFVNVPPGTHFVTAVAATGGALGTFPLFVWKGSATTVWALPQAN
jgi:hypothetical protein